MGKQMLKGNKTLPHGLLSSLTKREYFAGLAMQGILANKFIIEYINTELGIDWNCMSKELITECSIELSDALIDELNKR